MPVSTNSITRSNVAPTTPQSPPQEPPAGDRVWQSLDLEPPVHPPRGERSLRDRAMLNVASNAVPIPTGATLATRASRDGASSLPPNRTEEIESRLERDGPITRRIDHLAAGSGAASVTSNPGLLAAMREQASPSPVAGRRRRRLRGTVPAGGVVQRTGHGRELPESTRNFTSRVGQGLASFGAAFARAMETQASEEGSTTLERPGR